jgi:integrase
MKEFPAAVIEKGEFQKVLARVPTLMEQAMFCIQYATGCREGELVVMKHKDFFKSEKERFWLRFKTLKNPEHPLRAFPISKKKNEWLYKPILSWFKKDRGAIPEAWLFPSPHTYKKHISKRYLRKITQKYFGVRNHSFRHSRITHYFRKEGNIQKAVKLFGWSDGRPAMVYTHLQTKDLEGTEDF